MTMKKITFMIATAIMFAACNGGSNQSTTTDSTIIDSVSVDSVAVADSAVSVTDTTTAQIPVNGGGELGPRPTPIK